MQQIRQVAIIDHVLRFCDLYRVIESTIYCWSHIFQIVLCKLVVGVDKCVRNLWSCMFQLDSSEIKLRVRRSSLISDILFAG